jgi:hypothetical protein
MYDCSVIVDDFLDLLMRVRLFQLRLWFRAIIIPGTFAPDNGSRCWQHRGIGFHTFPWDKGRRMIMWSFTTMIFNNCGCHPDLILLYDINFFLCAQKTAGDSGVT